MKKIIFALLAFLSISASAEIIQMNPKDSKNELFIDTNGLYRYRRSEEIYQDECKDIFAQEARKKCLEAEKARWERDKTKEEVKRQGTLYTGKILVHSPKNKDTYYYVDNGKKGKKIDLIRDQYYFEKGLLYDIKTEEPISDTIVIGGIEGLAPAQKEKPRFIIQQDYENGQPSGNPVAIPVR